MRGIRHSGDQLQSSAISAEAYGNDDTNSPALKATEVRLMTAIAAADHSYNIYKTETKQSFLYDDLHFEDD